MNAGLEVERTAFLRQLTDPMLESSITIKPTGGGEHDLNGIARA